MIIARRLQIYGSGLFRKYFLVSSLCVLTSILILGVFLISSASKYFERDKYSMVEHYIDRAAEVTAQSYMRHYKLYVTEDMNALAYSVVSESISAEVYFTDLSGNIEYYSDSGIPQDEKLTLSGNIVPREIIARALLGGYSGIGNMHGFYDKPRFIVAKPVLADDKPFGIIFVSCQADDFLKFTWALLRMFLLSALVVLLMVSIFIYFITSRMVRPLKNMLDATQSFAQGDFSKRVSVSGYDEVGQLAMAFNNMASTLATTERSRRNFTANVSHELKTPMTTISGFVDGILDGTIPEEKRDQYLNIVSNECKRLSRLVRSMLDTARLEAGELEIRPSVFDVSEIIRQTIFTFEHTIEEKQLEITGLDADKVMIFADRDLIHQVIYNLIENAVKFVNEGGYIEVSYKTDSSKTNVTIRNSGKGIDREETPRLFDRFYKTDRSRGLDKDGVGLGLHIVKSIINYHNGEIMVRSIPGDYTEFEFTVPTALKT